MTRRDVNEGDVFRKGFATNALEGGATTGQVPAVAPDGQMEFVAGSGGSQSGAVRWMGPCKTTAFAGQNIFLDGGGQASGGTYTLTINGQTTAPIAWNANLAQIYAALGALSSVGVGNVGANPRNPPPGTTLNDGLELLFKDLAATTMLSGDGTALTGTDAPYTFRGGTSDMLIELFTPAVGDIIEDFFHVIATAFAPGAPQLSYTDSTSNPTQSGPAWSIPGHVLSGLELENDGLADFANFSGSKGSPDSRGQNSSLMAELAHWVETAGVALYTNFPARATNAVPIYSLISGVDNVPTQGEVWIYVKTSSPAPLMD